MKFDDDAIELVARICHETNRAYCEWLGENGQGPWVSAPEWQRDSARLGVRKHLKTPMTPEQSHASWSEQKRADGWVFGESKDPDAKTHPCLVPFVDLPREQKVKDFLFGHVVAAFREAAST